MCDGQTQSIIHELTDAGMEYGRALAAFDACPISDKEESCRGCTVRHEDAGTVRPCDAADEAHDVMEAICRRMAGGTAGGTGTTKPAAADFDELDMVLDHDLNLDVEGRDA